tara:strand:- start:4035 stop:5330 length:1296 start_codon:yes stop_codon:yes gene_type:complete
MASTYTVNTGIELIADGEQSGTWGDTTNTNLTIVDRLTSGIGSIALSGTTHNLTTSDGTLSQGQYKVLVFGGSPSGTNTVTVAPNDQGKQYFIVNNSGQSVIISQGAGSNVTVANGATDIVYCDGGGSGASVISLLSSSLTNFLQISNNLSDLASAATALTNLGLTATATELNTLDGITSTTAELNILDGVTATAAELNILDGVTASTAELNILDGVTSTTAELNLVDGSVSGSVVNSKAVIYSAGGQVNATSLAVGGTPITATVSELNILDGVTATTAELNILDGVTATSAELNYSDITTLGTSEASKVVTADANGDVILSEELIAKSYNETYSAGSNTINCENGNIFSYTASGATTFSFINPPASGTAYGFTLIVTNSGANLFTWPASVDWPNGIIPAAPASGDTNVLVFMTYTGGTTWYGFEAGRAMS